MAKVRPLNHVCAGPLLSPRHAWAEIEVDDFEGGFNRIWMGFGSIGPKEDGKIVDVTGVPHSANALHVTSDDLAGTNFNGLLGVIGYPFDASAYDGVSFYAKIDEGTVADWALRLSDVNTYGGAGSLKRCSKCNDDFEVRLKFTRDWKRYDVNFAELAQSEFGDPQLPHIEKALLYNFLLSAKENVGSSGTAHRRSCICEV